MDTADPRALGQILLIQSMVAQLPTELSMLQFTARGLEGIPGIRKVWFRSGLDPPEQDGSRIFEVSHNGHCHAALCFAVANEALFSLYFPYLKNLAFMLGIVLNERIEREENQRYRTHLESLVEARTQALAASERRVRSMLRTALDGVWLLDFQGHFLEANEAACALLGYRHAELVGLNLDRIEVQATQALLAQPRPQGVCLFESRHRRKDGSELMVEVSATFHPELEQIVAFIRDISQRKQAEEALSSALRMRADLEKQAQHSQQMESLGRLAGGVAHDMNNVLGAILGLATLHRDDLPEASPIHGDFDIIARAAVRGGQMVKSLLDFAHQTPVQDLAVDLNGVVRDVVRLLERTTLARIRVGIELQPGLRPIRGDAGSLTHSVMNLCVNAVDAMPGEGTLGLRTRNLDNQEVELQVQDTGSGMSPEVSCRALDPFFTTKEVGKGTGLGLSMVYSAVKAHRGQIAIQSEPGQGTRVTLRFPSCEGRIPAPGRAKAPSGALPVPGLDVLLVDDDPLIQLSTQALLDRLGHATTSAASGEGALARLEAGYQPHVVILDLNMPGLGGAGTLPRLRAILPEVPVLLATGKPDQTAHDLVDGFPHVTLLAKPFSMDTLRRQLELLIHRPSARTARSDPPLADCG